MYLWEIRLKKDQSFVGNVSANTYQAALEKAARNFNRRADELIALRMN